MKRRLFSPRVVADSCNTYSIAARLRLAGRKNPSVSLVPIFLSRDTRQSRKSYGMALMRLWSAIGHHISSSVGRRFACRDPQPVYGGCINRAHIVRDDAQHPLYSLVAVVGDLIEAYEIEHEPLVN